MTSPRTNVNYPLRIDSVQFAGAGGQIGTTFCPVKCGASAHGASWARSAGLDPREIRDWGASSR